MAIKDYVKPYNDNKAFYDFDQHRYILTTTHANHQTGLNLEEIWEGTENLEWYLEYVSRVVYHYVGRYKPPHLYKKLTYYLSHSKEMRHAMIELMVDTIAYNFEDGGFLIAYQTGVNLKEMKDLDIKINRAISVVGDQILKNFMLKDRQFIYRFDVENDTYGTEW